MKMIEMFGREVFRLNEVFPRVESYYYSDLKGQVYSNYISSRFLALNSNNGIYNLVGSRIQRVKVYKLNIIENIKIRMEEVQEVETSTNQDSRPLPIQNYAVINEKTCTLHSLHTGEDGASVAALAATELTSQIHSVFCFLKKSKMKTTVRAYW